MAVIEQTCKSVLYRKVAQDLVLFLNHLFRRFQFGHCFFQFQALFFNVLLVTVQIEKYVDLTPDDIRVERFQEVIHSPYLIAFEYMLRVFADSGHKDNGDVTCLGSSAYQFRCFKSVHFRHLDVKENKGEIIFQEKAQGIITG